VKRFPLRRDGPTSVLRLNISNYVQDRTPRTDGTENPWRGNVEHFSLQLPPASYPQVIPALCVRVIMIMRKNNFDWAGTSLASPVKLRRRRGRMLSAIRPKGHTGGVTRWRSGAS